MIEATNVKIFMLRQVKFPRTKKKRIREKWCKDKKNWSKEELVGVANCIFPALTQAERIYGSVKII